MLHVSLIALVMFCFSSGMAFAAPLSATYTYDGRGRLVSVTYEDGGTVAYTYDAAGNRVREVVTVPAAAPAQSPVLSEAGQKASGG